jgi:glycosyltransferase involved in cell wall biosynthesis
MHLLARICLIAFRALVRDGSSDLALAELLSAEHEVVVVISGTDDMVTPRDTASPVRVVAAHPFDEPFRSAFACEAHARSAEVLAAIERAYGTGPGPDLLEAPDCDALSFVSLQAARTGHSLLSSTRMAVRLVLSREIRELLNDEWPEHEDGFLPHAMEREILARSDCILHAGGDTVRAYRRHYGEHGICPDLAIRPLPLVITASPPKPANRQGPLRLLYADPLELRLGVAALVSAVLRLPDVPIRLTVTGSDTPTAPLGRSMRATLTAMIGNDDRVTLHEAATESAWARLIADHDVVVVPPRFATWSALADVAMRSGVPVLATPVGGLVGQVEEGVTGWLTRSTDAAAIADGLARVVDDQAMVDRVGSNLSRHQLTLWNPQHILAHYRALLDQPLQRTVVRPLSPLPRVTAIVPSHNAPDTLEEAVHSFLRQTGDRGDVVVVDDGSSPESMPIFDTLLRDRRVRVVHQRHSGTGAARNTGLLFADGDYVLTLDADDTIEPGFVERAIATLAADPELGYATMWVRLGLPPKHGRLAMKIRRSFPEIGLLAARGDRRQSADAWCALGVSHSRVTDRNVYGCSCVMFPRRVFSEFGHRYYPDSAIGNDRELLIGIVRSGLRGIVIPALLFNYRKTPTGLTALFSADYRSREWRVMWARLRAKETQWTRSVE